MGTTVLEERMASNLKEKERANETAEVAARGSEDFVIGFPSSGGGSEFLEAKSDGNGDVYTLGGFLSTPDSSASDAEFIVNANWSVGTVYTNPPFDDNALIGTGVDAGVSKKYAAKPQSIIEEFDVITPDLNQESRANYSGEFYYRVTGRGVGGNDSAVSIVQSMVMQRYR